MASTSPRRSFGGDLPSPSTPLISSPTSSASGSSDGPLGRLTSLCGAARFIRRPGSRCMMREPSVAVRETAAEHLEERQTDWAYSKPVIVLDMLWNLAFVAVAATVLAASMGKSPTVPLRIWIACYVLQCFLHILCVTVKYRRRRRDADLEGVGDEDFKLRRASAWIEPELSILLLLVLHLAVYLVLPLPWLHYHGHLITVFGNVLI